MDPILFWNDVANEANRVTHTTGDKTEAAAQGPCGSSRAYAMVHLAMHDAYFSIDKATHGTYLDEASLPTPPQGANAAETAALTGAAVAAAAYTTLCALYPAQKKLFDDKLVESGVSTGGPSGAAAAFGAAVGARMLAERAGDPSLSGAGHSSSNAPGRHRHDPDAAAADHGYHAPFYGSRARCFAIDDHFPLAPPPAPGSQEYLDALREVRALGIAPELVGTLRAGDTPRTPDQTVGGIYWGYDGAKELGTPPRLYNQFVRVVAEAQGNTTAQNARLFALVNAAMGDAGIRAWDDKYLHDLWRPVLGIREHGTSLGPAATAGKPIDADADPGWRPLGAPRTNQTGGKNFTPPFPAYPSGHATFGAAAFQSVRRFYDEACGYEPDTLGTGLEFVSDEYDGVNRDNHGTVRPRHVRRFDSLWEMIEENGRSRVWLGVHWVFDAFAVHNDGKPDLTRNIGGVPLGLRIADNIAARGLKATGAAGPRLP
ncbi:MAG TPA: hypothetical protein VM367_02320 [Pseudonocardia sp.]|nr:hypothetical protein [Pseudonocardia sp.]